jgi:hypothetical protein
MTMPTMSLSASSSYEPLFCPFQRPGILFLLLGFSDAELDNPGLDWDGVLAAESEDELVDCDGRHERIFGIEGRKYLAW